MTTYREQVTGALQATVFHSLTSFSWFGNLSPRLAPAIRGALPPQTARDYLLYALQTRLYEYFYTLGVATPSSEKPIALPAAGMTPFVQELSAANAGSGYWEVGCQVGKIECENVAVQRKDLWLWLSLEDSNLLEASQLIPGLELKLRFPRETLGLSPGFYLAFGDRGFSEAERHAQLRFYWNITPSGAVQLMQLATTLLNQAELPFRLKCLNDPANYTRCDAAVLYIPKANYQAVADILQSIYPEIMDRLKPGIPAFTKLLATGVGLAEDPGLGDSFGQHRCRILADGMIRSYEQGLKSLEQRLQVVEQRLAEEGIDINQPFLNPGSEDHYGSLTLNHKPGATPEHSTHTTVNLSSPYAKKPSLISPSLIREDQADLKTCLHTARMIGERLVKETVWDGEQCNWIGAAPDPILMKKVTGIPYRALETDLYSGTSGVALFLAYLYQATGEPVFKRTAIGAIRQALSHLERIDPINRLGFYAGWLGIAFSAALMSSLLEEGSLLEQAARLTKLASEMPLAGKEFDLIFGYAGGIIASFMLEGQLGEASLLDFAARLGNELLMMAHKAQPGYSWKSQERPTLYNLTGFSHGAAGVGFALLELYLATGETKYRQAAERAFDYERYWFNPQLGNWPDFRERPGNRRHRKRPLAYGTHWCHGAPGIAISRLRAYEVFKQETYKTEALTALQTTGQSIQTWLSYSTGNYSLCHGLCGNVEVLLYGEQVLGNEFSNVSKLASQVALAGIENNKAHSGAWICGTGAGETPGLMQGLAGIGLFYLRQYNPAIPSVLIPISTHKEAVPEHSFRPDGNSGLDRVDQSNLLAP